MDISYLLILKDSNSNRSVKLLISPHVSWFSKLKFSPPSKEISPKNFFKSIAISSQNKFQCKKHDQKLNVVSIMNFYHFNSLSEKRWNSVIKTIYLNRNKPCKVMGYLIRYVQTISNVGETCFSKNFQVSIYSLELILE